MKLARFWMILALFVIGEVTAEDRQEARCNDGLLEFASDKAQDGQNYVLSGASFYTYRRYYYIERLQKTIQLLTKIKYQINQIQFLVRGLHHFRVYGYTFSHPKIRRNLDEIIRTRSLKPLFLIWDDFTIYKFLEDDLFVEEFTQEIFVVTKSVFLQNMLQRGSFGNDTFVDELDQSLSKSLEDRLCEIDYMAEYLQTIMQKVDESGVKQAFRRNNDLQDVIQMVASEDVLQRFYTIRRLFDQIHVLDALEQSGMLTFLADHISESEVLNEFSRHEPLLVQAIMSALIAGDTHAMCVHLEDFGQFKFLFDKQYTHSLVASLLIIYVHILRCPELSVPPEHRLMMADIQKIFEIYHRIDQLPVEEVLGAIDLATKAIQKIIAHRNENKGTLELLAGSWWSRAMTLVSLLIKVGNVLFGSPKKVGDVEK